MTKNAILYFVISALLMLSSSCSKSEPEVEVISIEQLLGEDDIVNFEESEIIEVPALDGSFVSEINQKLYTQYSLESNTKRTLMDRFSASSVEKSNFISKSDSLASIEFYMYSFPDSTATMNAFNNLLACFGTSCEEIALLENRSRVDEKPMWCGVFESSIVILKFSPSAIDLKNKLKQTVFQTKGEALKYTLNVSAAHELKWD